MRRPDFFSSSDAEDRAFDAWLDGESPDEMPATSLTDGVHAARQADATIAASVTHVDRSAMLRRIMAAPPSRRWSLPRPVSLLRSPAISFATIALVLLALVWGIRDLTHDDTDDLLINYEPVATLETGDPAPAASPVASPVATTAIVPEWLTFRLEASGHTVDIGDELLRANQFPWLAGQAVTIDGIASAVFPADTRIDAQMAFYPILTETLELTDQAGRAWQTEQPSYVWLADHVIVVMYDATYDAAAFSALSRAVLLDYLLPGATNSPVDPDLLDWTDIAAMLESEGFDVAAQESAASTQALTYSVNGVANSGRRLTVDGRTTAVFALPHETFDTEGTPVEIDPVEIFAAIDQESIELQEAFLNVIPPEGTWRAFLIENVIIVIDDDPARTDDTADRMAELFPSSASTRAPTSSPQATAMASTNTIVPEWLTTRLEESGHTIEAGELELNSDQLPGFPGQAVTIDGIDAAVFVAPSAVAARNVYLPLLVDTLTLTYDDDLFWKDDQPTSAWLVDEVVIVMYAEAIDYDAEDRFGADIQAQTAKVGKLNVPIDTSMYDITDISNMLSSNDITFATKGAVRTPSFSEAEKFGTLLDIEGQQAAVFTLPPSISREGPNGLLTPEDVYTTLDPASFTMQAIDGSALTPKGVWRAFLIDNVIIVIDDDPARTDDAADRMAALFPTDQPAASPEASPIALREG